MNHFLGTKFWNIAVFVLAVNALAFAGCVRYTAPRSELTDRGEKGGDSNIGDSAAFLAYEQRLADKLSKLIEERNRFNSSNGDTTYKIGPGDVLALEVFGFSDLSTETEVSSDGTISLPMVGDGIPAAGLSVGELRNSLVKRLSRFVRNPRVQLTMKQYQASKVFVVGEVAKPGTYALKRNGQQLIELLSEAGGRTDRASGRVVLVPSSTTTPANGATSSGTGVEIAMDDLIGNADTRPLQIPVMSGDTIIVPEAGTVDVYGEVESPGSHKLASRSSALGAIASAGGFTYAAKVDEVEVIRDIGGGKRAAIVLNLEDVALKGFRDTRLRDGDVVRVPSESGSFFRRQLVDAINGSFRGVGVSAR